MKLFLDSANHNEIESCLKVGILSGITTNPTILAREGTTDIVEHFRGIVKLLRQYEQEIPLSVEVLTNKPEEMLDQALRFIDLLEYEALNIKIPMGWEELGVISELTKRGIPVNCTCLFNEEQALLAANAGALYLSLFLGRLRDRGGEPLKVIHNVRQLLDQSFSASEILVASLRTPRDCFEAIQAGGDIITAPMKHLQACAQHPMTEEAVNTFMQDIQSLDLAINEPVVLS